MDRYELIRTVALNNKVSYRLAEKIILKTFDVIAGELSKGGKVTVSGFGTFEVKEKSTRVARNLKTGEAMELPERKMPFFKAHPKLKKVVESGWH